MSATLTAKEALLAGTQLIDIAAAILPAGTKHRTVVDEERFEDSSQLSINRNGRGWHMYGVGGITAVGLVQCLCGYSRPGCHGVGQGLGDPASKPRHYSRT